MSVLSKGVTFADGEQITSTRLNNLVDNAQFDPNAVDDATIRLVNNKIVLGTAQTANIANSAVTGVKIANSAVSGAKIASGAITDSNVNTNAAIAGTKIVPDFGSQNIATTGQASVGTNSFTSTVDFGKRTKLDVLGLDGNIRVSNTEANNTDKFGRLILRHFDSNENNTFLIGGTNSLNDNVVRIGGGSSTLYQSTVIAFYTASNTTSTGFDERMRINSSGNVGIGTIGPTERLVVNGNVRASSFIPTSSTVTTNGLYAPATNVIALSTASTERLRISSNGNVGIGTTSPNGLLQVEGQIRSNTTNSSATVGLRTSLNDTAYTFVGDNLNLNFSELFSFVNPVRVRSPDYIVLQSGGTNERLRVTSAGNIGIGTSTPSSRLQVNGTVTATSFSGPLTGNASTATTLATGRNFQLSGDVTSSAVSFNGSGNVTLSGTIANGAITAAKLSGNQTGSAPAFVVRAAAEFTLSNPRDIRHAYNIATVTRLSSGTTEVAFTTPMPNANYIVVCGNAPGATGNSRNSPSLAYDKTTTGFKLNEPGDSGSNGTCFYVIG